MKPGDILPDGRHVLDIWKNISGGQTVFLSDGSTHPIEAIKKMVTK
jgi:hypothetical protein